MDREWQTYDAWIAYFDVLGFKEELNKIRGNNNHLRLLQGRIDEIIRDLQAMATEFKENVDCLFYADTFIFYSRSSENRIYPGIIRVATHFTERCLTKGTPLRGAISFGNIAVGYDKRSLIGKAFLESYLFCEDQNWLGLILTPSASRKVKEIGLDPAHHHFINCDIPLQKYSIFDEETYAYTFCRGVTNFPCPYLEKLREMKQELPGHVRVKYENTMKFIEKYHRVEEAGGAERASRPPEYDRRKLSCRLKAQGDAMGTKTTKKKSTRKYSPAASKKVQTEMKAMKQGKLRSGRSGKKVTSRKQAVAIGLSEARKEGMKVPAAKG